MYLHYMWTLGNCDCLPKVMGHLVTEVTFKCFILEGVFHQPFTRLVVKVTFG